MTSRLAAARSYLFVPGDRPDRYQKAVDSGADVVVIDLEDAVTPDRKAGARREAAAWLAGGGAAIVRINDARTDHHRADVDALREGEGLLGVMVPKAETPEVLSAVAVRTEAPVVALVESAIGMRDVHALAAAPGVVRLAFGHLDYALDLGAAPDDAAMLHARSTLVLASRVAGLAGPVDGVTTALGEGTTLARDVRRASTLGMTGKLLIHPNQVSGTHEAFRPSEEDVRWACAVVEAPAVAGAARVDGQMVDAPVIARAEAILRRARWSGSPVTRTSAVRSG
ncbi:CoA ester lyase [Pimelobacter simplex]|nr:CoA ester lyase [Pimelobacter simplex]